MTERTTASGLGRDVAVYGVASLIAQGAVVIATPVFARTLGPAGYGELDLLLAGVNLAVLVAIAGTDTAALQQYFLADGPAEREGVFSSGLVWTLVAGLVVACAAYAASGPIAGAMSSEPGALTSVRLAASVIPALTVARFTLEALRARRQPWRYLASVVILSGVQLLIGVVWVVRFDGGVPQVMAAWLIGSLASLAYNVVTSGGLLRLRVRRAQMRRILTIGLPLLFAGLAGWSVMFVDRLVLVRIVSLRELGIYALAAKVSLLLTLVIYSFNRGWTPVVLEATAHDAPGARSMRARTSVLYLASVAWIAVAASLLAPAMVGVLGGKAFAQAADLVPVLAAAFLLLAPMPVIQVSMLVTARTSLLAWPACVAAVVNAAGVVALASYFGLMGAALATVAGFLVQLVLTFVFAQRIDPVDYPWTRLGVLTVVTASAMSLSWVPPTTFWLSARVLLALVFPTVLVAAGVVRVGELRSLTSMFDRSR